MGQLLLAAEDRINTECFNTRFVSRENLLYTVTIDWFCRPAVVQIFILLFGVRMGKNCNSRPLQN